MEVIDMNIEYDLGKICRCCRRESADLQPIFQPVGCFGGITLYEMLAGCSPALQLSYSGDDGMPANLCGECVADCNAAYGFRKRCEQSDVLLREYLSRRKVLGEAGVKVELFDIKPDIGEPSSSSSPYVDSDPLIGEKCFVAAGGLPVGQQDLIEVDGEGGELDGELMTVEFVEDESDGEEDVDYEVDGLDEMIEELEELKPRRRSVQGRKVNGYSKIKGGKFACDSCDRVFTDRRGITNHVKQHELKEVKPCPLCQREFTSAYHLNRHIKMHENDTECETCEKRFALYHDYKDHMAMEHPGEILVEEKLVGKVRNLKIG